MQNKLASEAKISVVWISVL